jgi:general secretion pathway protein G
MKTTTGGASVTTSRKLRSAPWRGQQGFSLIEIIIVLGILGTLIAVLITNLTGGQESAKKKETTVKAGSLQAQLLRYQADMGQLPTTADGLDVLVTNPGSAKWTGPYLQADDLNDAFGFPFAYELSPRGPKLTSPGPDGSPGTEDDMVYVGGRLQESAGGQAAPTE